MFKDVYHWLKANIYEFVARPSAVQNPDQYISVEVYIGNLTSPRLKHLFKKIEEWRSRDIIKDIGFSVDNDVYVTFKCPPMGWRLIMTREKVNAPAPFHREEIITSDNLHEVMGVMLEKYIQAQHSEARAHSSDFAPIKAHEASIRLHAEGSTDELIKWRIESLLTDLVLGR